MSARSSSNPDEIVEASSIVTSTTTPTTTTTTTTGSRSSWSGSGNGNGGGGGGTKKSGRGGRGNQGRSGRGRGRGRRGGGGREGRGGGRFMRGGTTGSVGAGGRGSPNNYKKPNEEESINRMERTNDTPATANIKSQPDGSSNQLISQPLSSVPPSSSITQISPYTPSN